MLNRRDELIREWTESGFSPELIRIASESPMVKHGLDSVIVEESEDNGQEVFGVELGE